MLRISPFSRAYLRRRAVVRMEDHCQIWHPQPLNLQRSTGVASVSKGTLLYDGPCRVWQTTPGDHTFMGDEQVTTTNTYLSLPYDSYIPRHDDVVFIDHATDPGLQGIYLQTISASLSGGLRASRRFTVSVMKNARKDSW